MYVSINTQTGLVVQFNLVSSVVIQFIKKFKQVQGHFKKWNDDENAWIAKI